MDNQNEMGNLVTETTVKSGSKTALGVMLGVIVALLLVAGTIYGIREYTSQKAPTEGAIENDINTSNPDEPMESEKVDTSDWKTYSGEDGAGSIVTIKYPQDWYAVESREDGGLYFKLTIQNTSSEIMDDNYYAFSLVSAVGSGAACVDGMEYGESTITFDKVNDYYTRGKYTTMAQDTGGYVVCSMGENRNEFALPVVPGPYHITYMTPDEVDLGTVEILDQILLSMKTEPV